MADESTTTDRNAGHADPGASQTDWSMIYQAAHGEEKPAQEAWDVLTRRYWPAIYAFIRSSGEDVHGAADLTQGFVCDVMLHRRLLQAADPERGRFRTLLLTSLRNYLTERHRARTRRKRSPETGAGKRLLELDRDELRDMAISSDATPESSFDAEWSAALVRRVVERVRQDCLTETLSAHWSVFEARVVKPMLLGATPTPYHVLVDTLDLKDAGQAANMMITVKRRFARALYEEVGATVQSVEDVDEELKDLLRSLEGSR